MNEINSLLSILSAFRTDLTFDSLVESFHGEVKVCIIALDKLMLYYLIVINKDVTTEEVQRVEDLVTYLEGQNSETGLQKQVLLLCRFKTRHFRILLSSGCAGTCCHWLLNHYDVIPQLDTSLIFVSVRHFSATCNIRLVLMGSFHKTPLKCKLQIY